VYGEDVFDALRKAAARARLFAGVVRSTGVVQPVRPAGLLGFARAARRTPFGPHLAVMFHARAQPDKEALVEYGDRGVTRLTWAELDATINRLANALLARGAGGRRVALMLPNTREYLIAQYALARIGATAIQISYHLKPGEIAHILANAEPHATLVHADQLAAITAARGQVGQQGPMIVVGAPTAGAGPEVTAWDTAVAEASPAIPVRQRGDGGGVIVYTSGTTGKSKGAHRTWRATGYVPAADLMHQVGIRADDRHLVVCPLYHSAAPGFVVMLMALGATIVLMNQFEPTRALDIIERERVTCTLMVPTMIVRLANLPDDARTGARTASLRWVMSVAAPLPTDAARRFMLRFGPILWNFYGATETGLVTLAGPGDHLDRPGTIGRALCGNEIQLVGDDGREVADGEIGELYVRNSMLISGYHKNTDAMQSAQRAGMFSVGDLARRDGDGYYYLESRKHDLVISGGVNIYPREIEDHLLAHPAILDAAVIGVPDPEWGESLCAFVVLRAGHALSEPEVIAYCRAGLADFKRPRKVVFVAELPRNPTGKILKRELRDPR
jgi:fatty-acyl-CoA synthase